MNSAAAVMESPDKSCQSKGTCGCRGGKSPWYLATLTLVAWGLQLPMLAVVVPKFAEYLRDFGVQLPAVSRLVIVWSEWMQAPIGSTFLTGTMVFGAAVVLLSLVALTLAKVGGGFGRALVVMLALLGGAVACGQAAAVIIPTMSAQSAIQNAGPTTAP
jgi:hypothetical protein